MWVREGILPRKNFIFVGTPYSPLSKISSPSPFKERGIKGVRGIVLEVAGKLGNETPRC